MGGVRQFDRTQSSVLLTHSPSILSYNSIILLYFDVFLFCILRNPNLQGIDFFFCVGFGNLLGEQRDEMRGMRDSVRTDDLSRVIW